MADRLPPHSVEAEQGVLGCILLDPQLTINNAVQKIERGAEVFYDLRHQRLYDEIVELFDSGQPVDPITLQDRLKNKNCLEALGGMPYIASLMNVVPSAANLEYYLDIVAEKAYARNLIAICTQTIQDSYASTDEINEFIDGVESRILGLRRAKVKTGTRKESLFRVVNQLEDAHQGREVPGVLKTGFADIDKMLNGLWPGTMTVIAGRPATGKSTLAMNIAENVAIDDKLPVGYFSLEMSEDMINARSLASRGRVNLKAFARKQATKRDFDNISRVMATVSNAKIEIDYSPGMTITQLRAKARRMVTQAGIKLIVVDMIQLVSASGRRSNRVNEVDEVARGLKALAGELNIPLIAVSSMNREFDKDSDRRPRLSDLRESGEIESSADTVLMLWCPDPTSEQDYTVKMSANIPKCRSGETCEIELLFIKKFNRFETLSQTADVPTHWQND